MIVTLTFLWILWSCFRDKLTINVGLCCAVVFAVCQAAHTLAKWYLIMGHELICKVVIWAECPSDLTLYQQSGKRAYIAEQILNYLNDFIYLYV